VLTRYASSRVRGEHLAYALSTRRRGRADHLRSVTRSTGGSSTTLPGLTVLAHS